MSKIAQITKLNPSRVDISSFKVKASARKLLFWLCGSHKEKAQLWLVCFQIHGIYWPLIKISWQNTDYEPSDTFLSMGGYVWGLGVKRFLRVFKIQFTLLKVLNELLSKHYKLAKFSAYLQKRKKKKRKRQIHSPELHLSCSEICPATCWLQHPIDWQPREAQYPPQYLAAGFPFYFHPFLRFK